MQRAGVSSESMQLSGPVARAIADYTGQLYSLSDLRIALEGSDLTERVEATWPVCRG
jgi:hypothetical protein